MEDKKTFSLSISKTNDDGTTSNVSLNTPYADEVMALLRLSGVAAPEASPSIEVVAEPHAMSPCGMEPEMVATEEYANEPNDTCYDNQAVSNFSLKRNMQKMNAVGNYRGDNKLGDVTESLEAKYQTFKKKQIRENDAHDAAIDNMKAKIQKQGNKVVGMTYNDKTGETTITFTDKKGTKRTTTVKK
jgi:hypothetical protein